MDLTRLEQILDRASSRRITVIGDLMLDEFVWGKVGRISPEAPVPVVEVTGESFYPGGAANVARNLREFVDHVAVIGMLGKDRSGRQLRELLAEQNIDTSSAIEDERFFTIVKTRIIALHQQVVRVDREKILTPSSAQIAMAVAAGKIVAADPNPQHSVDWRGVTVVKPNRAEAFLAAGIPWRDAEEPLTKDTDLERAGKALLQKWETQYVLITLGEHGMVLFRQNEVPYYIRTKARQVFDVSGAGDTAIALFTLGLVSGATPIEAAEIANHGSAVVVSKLGTATVTRDELIASFRENREDA